MISKNESQIIRGRGRTLTSQEGIGASGKVLNQLTTKVTSNWASVSSTWEVSGIQAEGKGRAVKTKIQKSDPKGERKDI